MTKQEYIDWRSSVGTKEVFDELENRIKGLQEELSYNAGVDARQDAIKVGAIQAFRDILDTTYTEVTND